MLAPDLPQSAQRVIAQRRPAAGARTHQAVLSIIDIAAGAIRREVAIGIIAKVRRPGGQILVEAVDGVVARHVDAASPHIAAVVAGLGRDLIGGVFHDDTIPSVPFDSSPLQALSESRPTVFCLQIHCGHNRSLPQH